MCDQHLSEEERAARPKGAVRFVDELVVAMTNSRIYSGGHPRLESSLGALVESFDRLQGEHEDGGFELGCADGFLFYDRRPLLGASLSSRRLIDPLVALESGGIAFDPRTQRDHLRTLVAYLSTGCKDAETYTQANESLDRQGCPTVRFLPPYTGLTGDGGPYEVGAQKEPSPRDVPTESIIDLDEDIDLPINLYQDVVYVLQDAMMKTCRGETIDVNEALGNIEAILRQLEVDTKSMMSLARYEAYDEFTFGHSIRVCFIALNFARHLTDDRALLERIGLAALLHDIGKAWVPFEVLHSTGLLSDEEREEMSLHTVYGGQILLDTPDSDPLAVAVAFSHHQTPSGGGYPRSVRAGPQSAATAIVKLCDVYEALTAVRPYKPRMSPTRAYRIMMSMQDHFDPVLFRRFIEVNGIYPVGSRVKLDSGELARVESQTGSLTQPVVTTTHAASGESLFREDAAKLDLQTSNAGVVEMLQEAEM